MFLFRSSEAERSEAIGTPERAQRSLAAWMKWVAGLEADGHLVDRGKPLEPDGKVVRKADLHDGPYIEVKDLVLGYLIVRAPSIERAVELARSCPIVVGGGGSVEVRPVFKGMA